MIIARPRTTGNAGLPLVGDVGIGAGFISYAVIAAARGKAREVHPLMWGAAAAFVVYFVLGPIKESLGI